MKRYFALILVAVVTSFGCSMWNSDEVPGVPRLPRTKMSPDSVGIEVATVTLDASNIHLLDEIRSELDEQVLLPEQRRHLSRNGLIGGLIGTQLPTPLPLLLLESASRREHPTAESFAEMPDQQRFVQCRAGKRVGVGLWMSDEHLPVRHDDGEMAVSESFAQPICQVGVRCEQDGNGTIDVHLTPEIEHGPLRQEFVADNGAFHVEAKRARKSYDDLEMSFELAPGEILLVTCTAEDDMLGQRIFRNSTSTKQKLLLIRLAQIQIDVAFEEE